MKKSIFLILIFFLSISSLSGQIPQTVSYQGVLTDTSGTPLNGSYNLNFNFYTVPTSGSSIWSESQNVTVADGIFNVILGSINPLNLPFDTVYWLGISVDNGNELGPRIQLTASPYSLLARSVSDSSITTEKIVDGAITGSKLSDSTLQAGSNVTITRQSNGALEIGATSGSGFSLPFSGSTSSNNAAFSVENTGSGDGVEVLQAGRQGMFIGQTTFDGVQVAFAGRDGVRVSYAAANGVGIVAALGEGIAIGTTLGNGVWVDTTATNGVQVDRAAFDGIQIQSAGRDGFRVANAFEAGLYVDTTAINGVQVNKAAFDGIQIQSAGRDGFRVTNASEDGLYVDHAASDGVTVSQADLDGFYIGNAGEHGLYVQDATSSGVQINHASTGVNVQSANGIGMMVGTTGSNGIQINQAGIDGIQIQSVGRDGIRISGAAEYGVYATGTTAAALFGGDVTVTGTLTKGGGSFKIDHPLDPANKYLQHSFVESPDMMNVYNGNVTLNAAGEAVVKLPDYFESLNRDFRYQLTAIGKPGPNLYIADKITNSHFKIAGGQPGMEVSWQVTGIRQDPWANANRIKVEEEKKPEERGYYLNPKLYGQPESRNIVNVVHANESEDKALSQK